MTRDALRDYADNVAREYPEWNDSVAHYPELYKGPGNACARVITTLGISHDERLAFVAGLFDYPCLTSFKQLTVAQLKALDVFRDLLGDLYAHD